MSGAINEDILIPVGDKVLAATELLNEQCIGRHFDKHSSQFGIPELEGRSVAIFGVLDRRTAERKIPYELDTDAMRMELYKLMFGNWNLNIVDLGDVPAGNTKEDTEYAVKNIIEELLGFHIVPLILGATQDVSYASYRAFDQKKVMVHMGLIDSKFDFGAGDELISDLSYMSRIITKPPNNLRQLTQLGYQSYFVAQEVLDLSEQMNFETYRLGEVTKDIRSLEPILRGLDLVSMDMQAIKASEVGIYDHFSPNGFDGREICALARYSAMGDSLSLFGIYNIPNGQMSFALLAQIVWYFFEGLNLRYSERPTLNDDNYVKYTVTTDIDALTFYKSLVTNRWWLEVQPSTLDLPNMDDRYPFVIACDEEDYQMACANELPHRYILAQRRSQI